MSRMYDMNNAKDIKALNQILNDLGIHLERNMFDMPYVILDHTVYNMVNLARKKSTKKPCPKRTTTRIQSTTSRIL